LFELVADAKDRLEFGNFRQRLGGDPHLSTGQTRESGGDKDQGKRQSAQD
jgi:hypothetical protein